MPWVGRVRWVDQEALGGRLHLPPEALEQEFPYFNVAKGFFQILSPGIDAVSLNQVAVGQTRSVDGSSRGHLFRQLRNVLRVFEDGEPLTMFVALDAGEPLEHFESLEEDSAMLSKSLREDG